MNPQFGAGSLYGRVAGKTPVYIGALQDVDVSFEGSIKELFGQYQFPLAIGRGTGKVTGKAKFASIKGDVLATLYFNETPATGQTLMAIKEANTIPGTPFKITVTHAATFVSDYGVLDALTGLPYKKVTGTPTTGQYSVDEETGMYTFAAADTLKDVLISYTYTAVTGQTITINNQLLGDAPVFECVLQQTFNLKTTTLILYKCVSSKLTYPTKLEDFVIQEFDFGAFCNDAGVLGILSLPE